MFEGIAVALAVVLVAAKFRITTIRRLLAFHAVLDVVFTVGLVAIMGGTYHGIVAAVVGGAILSVVLVIARRVMGYEVRVYKTCDLGHKHAVWERREGFKFRTPKVRIKLFSSRRQTA